MLITAGGEYLMEFFAYCVLWLLVSHILIIKNFLSYSYVTALVPLDASGNKL
jgi:hypothetical protein